MKQKMLQHKFNKTRCCIFSKSLLILSGLLCIGGISLLNLNASAQSTSSTGDSSELIFNGIKSQYLDQYFSTVHFSVAGNDFGGGFFWLPTESLANPQEIRAGGETLNCYGKIRGYYYNSQRGERLWPLDEKSKQEMTQVHQSYSKVNIQGGLYTNCTRSPQGNGSGEETLVHAIYGKITHTYQNKQFNLHAGLQNNTANNTLSANLKCNLQRVANAYPLGYLYDSQGGIALVGLRVKPEKMLTSPNEVTSFHNEFTSKLAQRCVDSIFDFDGEQVTDGTNKINNRRDIVIPGNDSDAKTTMMNLGIRGIIGLTNEVQVSDQKGIEGNTRKTSLLVSTENSISSIINAARKNAEELCRNKWSNKSQNQTNNIICFLGNTNKTQFSINPQDQKYVGKTIIVKNGNLKLLNYMQANNSAITIFIDKGKLILPSSGSQLTSFTPNGYTTNTPANSGDNIVQANYLKGTFIINGIMIGENGSGVLNRLVIHGKLASFNTIDKATDKVLNRVKNIVHDQNLSSIGLREIFTRTCGLKGIGSDNTSCKGVKSSSNNKNDFLTDKAFGLIDMYFPSPLFR